MSEAGFLEFQSRCLPSCLATRGFVFRAFAGLALSATLAGCSIPYRTALEWINAEEMLARGFLEGGAPIRVTILREGKLAAGHYLVLKTRPEPLVLPIGPNGTLDVPLRPELYEQNPWLEVRGKHGAVPFWSLGVSFSATLSVRGEWCEEGGSIDSRDPSTFPSSALGPDVVYAEPGVSEDEIESSAALLAQQRAELARLFGRPPPSVGVLLLAGVPEKTIRLSPDREGRMVWTLSPSERVSDRSQIGAIVHEWTHEVLRENFGLVPNDDARYLEDGLCELIAQRVHLAIRKTPKGSAADDRKREFQKRERPIESFDLIELARANTHRMRAENLATVLDSLRDDVCHPRGDSVLGYQVGLAWWLSQSDADPNFLKKTLAALEENPDLEAVLRAYQPGLDMNALPFDAVGALLKRHGG